MVEAEGNPVTPEKPAKKRRTRKKKGPKVTVKPQQHDARALVTIGPDHPAWGDGEMPDVKGAIVRLKPPAAAEPEVVDAVEETIRARGAVAVKRLPPDPSGDVVVRGKAEAARPALPHRELVDAMARAANVPDKDALVELVGAVMDEEGI